MTEVDDLFGTLSKKPKETLMERIKRTHPYFDTYPDYLKQSILANEKLQGRV